MKLQSIETTPSPHCMKLNLDALVSAKPLTFSHRTDVSQATPIARHLLGIEGVQEVFLMKDFITLMRKSHADWQPILAEAVRLIGLSEAAESGLSSYTEPLQATSPGQANSATDATGRRGQNFGQVEVAVQLFRGLPVQVRVIAADGQQAKVALPDRFHQALQRAIQATQANYIGERRWEPYPPQFGSPNEVALAIADELASLIDDDELAEIERAAIANGGTAAHPMTQAGLLEELQHSDWKHRQKALQQIEVNSETFPAVVACLSDERISLRRWAAAILGSSGLAEAVEPLSQVVLSDSSAIVRRTAGDALSDLGNEQAIPTLCQALADTSPLVRWRAARFLNELGDQTAVEPLHQAAAQEEEFDVRIEMLAAVERIEGGHDTQLPMWMRMTQGVS